MKRIYITLLLLLCLPVLSMAQNLANLQQKFVDLRFGMFIHFGIPTYANADWPDPELSPSVFNPTKLNADQWAKAAKSANMSYGCLTTKHHSGFCIWDTKTTDYSVMSSPLKRDVVKEYCDAFRKNGLKVMLYYSILDTHHKLRPNQITPKHVEMVKAQITELLTKYGKIEALIIDGWDAPWSRITYDEIPFEEIYLLVKKLQPDCLLMDLNGAKYPAEGLFYTDIKTYEMGAGQRISKETNKMPALACLPLQNSWFWKTDFPTTAVKDPAKTVSETLVPLNNASCNYILNVAPNRDGLMDENALTALTEIGKLWKNEGPVKKLPETGAPIISTNLAKNKAANSSWGDDMNIMDFANDDSFRTSWQSNPEVKEPWLEVDFKKPTLFNAIAITEQRANIQGYKLEYFAGGTWRQLFSGVTEGKVKVHRFSRVTGTKVRIKIASYERAPSIAEFGVYNEKR
ncbi:alpha-L-fucosidase [Mucilaginibacter myungsuensis]|uniref:alpha-L-fucosidase n=1 Tax=Mucilaginibacter myungsuensis TaxID=649104 RepID=A0A929KYL6_9SPHI|nr:alpha-L-fucosidase [Mucilaginibacter myungsuensis]MBE9664076.1 alpha-L-fucosidase [Mucilaginibacter myungsuensis]MDN3601254.1 alpha-L-fucosidase [Mucilaginibacter myungsuensis]